MSSGALILAALTSTATATTTTTEAPRIDLITIGVAAPMYAVYGHTAIRVVRADGRDTAYNFGGVDMQQPNFWARLMRGRIEAFLDVTPYSDLLLKYSAEDRTIVGRTLAFPPDVARAIVEELDATAADEEKKTYLYHHIFDNCTTRIGTLFDRHLHGRLKAVGQYEVRGTHRDWILDRIRWKPWVYLAMDLAGNGMGDVPLVAWDTIFIPEGLDAIIDRATFDGRPFVKSKHLEYRSMSYSDPPIWDWPWLKVYILLGLPLLVLGAWRPRAGGAAWGLIAGTLGVMYAVFWVISDYDFYHDNVNMLVFAPTHLVMLWVRRPKLVARYATAHLVLLLLLLGLSATGVIVQAIGPMLALAIPIEAVLVYRTRTAAR